MINYMKSRLIYSRSYSIHRGYLIVHLFLFFKFTLPSMVVIVIAWQRMGCWLKWRNWRHLSFVASWHATGILFHELDDCLVEMSQNVAILDTVQSLKEKNYRWLLDENFNFDNFFWQNFAIPA